ncbi:MAG TPA: hypothetical protein VLS89_09605, partial [Candidatus Nanopelagicales bacterium]|nr:hypothetical protein [Candidatus Nanopelagicales bacterium]
LPHLYALVTQTTRGEVAVIDLTTNESPVLDQDPSVPGANFLHVGAQPVDIVSTARGTASFVAVAEVGREGIFALPSTMIRPSGDRPPTSLSSWPACSLPSAPGEVLLVTDPAGPEGERATCDLPYGATAYTPDEGEPVTPFQFGDLGVEGAGRQKLVVTLPEQGGFVVIDAQRLLDRDAGTYAPCAVERWVPLRTEVPPPGDPPAPPPAVACVNPAPFTPASLPLGKPRPSGVAFAGDRMFIGDLEVPVIHAVDMATPCEPVERAPLLTSSLDEPDRVVTTSRLAVSRAATPEFRRFLYAVDVANGSTMVFDVSDGATQRTPLVRPNPEWNPFQPPDRIQFSAPVRDLIVIDRDVPVVDPDTGVALTGVRCDPNPLLEACRDASDTDCDPETLYRTSSTFDSGAGPQKLRGVFTFALLTNGQIAVLDVDDLDAACRAPRGFSELLGCSAVGPSGFGPPENAPPGDRDADGVADAEDTCPYHYNPDQADTFETAADEDARPDGVGDRCDGLASTAEGSCNVVIPNAQRSVNYILTNEGVGLRGEPGVQLLPVLYDRAGTALQDAPELPQLRAPIPENADTILALAVGSDTFRLDSAPEGTYPRAGQIEGRHALLMNLEDPRAHVVNQAWALTYEAALPGFGDNRGNFRCVEGCGGADATQKRWDLYDPSGLFCAGGVQSAESVREQLVAADPTLADPGRETELNGAVLALADVAIITSELPEESNAHWSTENLACSYDVCRAEYGLLATPTASRELVIREAYEDHLVLDAPGLSDAAADLNCCFPGDLPFQIRARGQWLATSQVTGFLHHVIPDPATGICRESCDPTMARMNGRIRSATSSTPGCALAEERTNDIVICEGDPRAFINPMFRLAITHPAGTPPQRDMQFRFATQGSFAPLVVGLATSTSDIQPQSMRFVPATGELAITDGSLEGLLLVNTGTLDVGRQYF